MSKIHKRHLKTARVGFIYPDGHAVIIHEKSNSKAGTIEWVTIHEAVTNSLFSEGRVIMNSASLPLLRMANTIDARPATQGSGSLKTDELGIVVGSVQLHLDGAPRPLILSTLPGTLASDVEYQTSNMFGDPSALQQKFEDVSEAIEWSGYRIAEVVRADG